MTEDERIDEAIEYMSDYLDESELEHGDKVEIVDSVLTALLVDLEIDGFDEIIDSLCEGIKQAREEYEWVTLQ